MTQTTQNTNSKIIAVQKLIPSGPDGVVVYINHEFRKKHGWEAGDKVELYETPEGDLLVKRQ